MSIEEAIERIQLRESDFFEIKPEQLAIFREAVRQDPEDRYEFLQAEPKTKALITEVFALTHQDEPELVEDDW